LEADHGLKRFLRDRGNLRVETLESPVPRSAGARATRSVGPVGPAPHGGIISVPHDHLQQRRFTGSRYVTDDAILVFSPRPQPLRLTPVKAPRIAAIVLFLHAAAQQHLFQAILRRSIDLVAFGNRVPWTAMATVRGHLQTPFASSEISDTAPTITRSIEHWPAYK